VIAVPVYVVALTRSPAATGFTLAVESLPGLLIGPWAGVLLDRWDLARAMWIADLVAAAAVLGGLVAPALVLLLGSGAALNLIAGCSLVAVLGVRRWMPRPAVR
jgi:hypothetical protein